MKRIEEIERIKGDAYDYYISGEGESELFERVFLVDEILEEIKKKDKYFLIGEKGSGKTAYSVYMCRKEQESCFCKLSLVENTLYHRFLNMKKQKVLELSGIKDIWMNLLYLILAEHIEQQYGNFLTNQIKYKQLIKAINDFYSDAFKPELINAFEFVDNAVSSINAMTEQGLFSLENDRKREKSKKYIEQSYQISLMKIKDGFERAFKDLEMKIPMILFVDGIDARPSDIDNREYFDCITGLVNAVLEMNQTVFFNKNIKIMLLMRPDVMYKMPLHNLNQKLRGNSVLLNWSTSYKKYTESKLYRIADDYFMKQQEREYELGECWDHYFPYRVPAPKGEAINPFIEFLRYSLYKPRDILTMLNEMTESTTGKHFRRQNFRDMLSNYSVYLKGELKDYMLIYMSDIDYSNFILFFDYFIDCERFDYKTFVEKHTEYCKYLRQMERQVPPYMQTAAEALQLLYDSNIIGYSVKPGQVFWSYKERNYANMQPEVRKGCNYRFHKAYAKAFRLV